MTDQFKALVLTQKNGKVEHHISQLSVDDLPKSDVLVAVKYSSLNYKDCLAVAGRGKIVRQYPMIPGVDLTGEVLSSDSPIFSPAMRCCLPAGELGNAIGEAIRSWPG